MKIMSSFIQAGIRTFSHLAQLLSILLRKNLTNAESSLPLLRKPWGINQAHKRCGSRGSISNEVVLDKEAHRGLVIPDLIIKALKKHLVNSYEHYMVAKFQVIDLSESITNKS